MKYTLLYLFLSFSAVVSFAQAPGLELDFIAWGSSAKAMEAQLTEADIPFTPYNAQHKVPCTSFHHQGLRSRFLYEAGNLAEVKLSRAFGLSEMEQAEEVLIAWKAKIEAALPEVAMQSSEEQQQLSYSWKTAEVKIKLSLSFGMNVELLYTRADTSLDSTAQH